MMEGFTIWFTGLSGAGKSTLAIKAKEYLESENFKVQLLDGDIVRNEVGHLFGYSREERMKMSKVIRFTSKLLNRNGIVTIVAAIAPYQEMREMNRKEIDCYHEVYVNCTIDECIKRDTKGLYKKALNGEIKNVIGVDDVFEIPKEYDVEVRTNEETIEESMFKIKKSLGQRFSFLKEKG